MQEWGGWKFIFNDTDMKPTRVGTMFLVANDKYIRPVMWGLCRTLEANGGGHPIMVIEEYATDRPQTDIH